MRKATGRYMQATMFPSQLTWSRVILNSAATGKDSEDRVEGRTLNSLLFEMGPNHGQPIPPTAFKII